jgi:hypothetical protein
MRAQILLPLAFLIPSAAAGAPLDPLVAFSPLTLPNPPGATRSAGGIPGPADWQTRVDYGAHRAGHSHADGHRDHHLHQQQP